MTSPPVCCVWSPSCLHVFSAGDGTQQQHPRPSWHLPGAAVARVAGTAGHTTHVAEEVRLPNPILQNVVMCLYLQIILVFVALLTLIQT